MKCPKCSHVWTEIASPTARSGSGGTTAPPEQAERHAVPNKDICYVLEQHEKCPPEWKSFLKELRGYTRPISMKQWYRFCQLHMGCLGTQPPGNVCDPTPGSSLEAVSDDILTGTF